MSNKRLAQIVVVLSSLLLIVTVSYALIVRDESSSQPVNIEKISISLVSDTNDDGRLYVMTCVFEQAGVIREIVFFTKKPEEYEERMRIMCGEK